MRRFQKLTLLGAFIVVLVAALSLLAGGLAGEDRPDSALEPLGQSSKVWLEQTLGSEIPDRPAVLGTDEQMRTCLGDEQTAESFDGGCQAIALDDRILVRSDYWGQLVELQRSGPQGARSPPAYLLLHEHLHRTDTAPGAIEEGAVDALAYDLLPAWSKDVLGVALKRPAYAHYDDYVQIVRAASEQATGAHRNSRPAAQWRRQLWAADDEKRIAMLGDWADTLQAYDERE